MVFHYRKEALRTANLERRSFKDALGNCGLGVAGEAGEVADYIKKVIYHSKELDRDVLIKEMGDVYWYLEVLGEIIGVTTEEVQRRNIDKLRLRYPNGFSSEAANAPRGREL